MFFYCYELDINKQQSNSTDPFRRCTEPRTPRSPIWRTFSPGKERFMHANESLSVHGSVWNDCLYQRTIFLKNIEGLFFFKTVGYN